MPDNPEKSANLRPERDRRLHARQRIHSLSYVKMGDANGGIVLNISEGGISVQAAAVLDPTEPITMWLEIPRVPNRLEVTGEIAWLSSSKKEAGLRFVDLPEGTLQQIRKWMAREASPEKFEDENDPVSEEVVAPVEVAQADEGDVRDLTEANIMSADEIKGLESEVRPAEPRAAAETEEEEAEDDEAEAEVVASETADMAEIEANSDDDFEKDFEDSFEAGEDIDEESESELEQDAETEEQVELAAKASVEEKRETEAEIRDDATKDDLAGDESEADDEAEVEDEPQTEDELNQANG